MLLSLINVTKCPVKSKRKSPFFNSRVSVCVGSVPQVKLGVTVFSSLRSGNNRTLNDPIRLSREK